MCLMLRTNFFYSPPSFSPLPPPPGRISALIIILNYVKNLMLGRNCTAIVLCLHFSFLFFNISRKCKVSTLKEFEKCTSNCICTVNLSYFNFWKAWNWKLWLKTYCVHGPTNAGWHTSTEAALCHNMWTVSTQFCCSWTQPEDSRSAQKVIT